MPHAQHPPRIIRAAGLHIGSQQSELDEVELSAAAANAFEFAGNRLEQVYSGGEIMVLESGESARHRRHQGAGWITTVSCQVVHLQRTRSHHIRLTFQLGIIIDRHAIVHLNRRFDPSLRLLDDVLEAHSRAALLNPP